MIPRFIENQILSSLKPGKVIGLFGARRTGKTVLMNMVKEKLKNKPVLMVNGENLDVIEILASQRLSILEKFVSGYKYLFIDEAQKIPNIGLNLKLIVDNIPGISIFVSGSSAFDLKNKIGEPLVGRSKFYYFYPIAQLELNNYQNFLKNKENLEDRLIYGMYPQVLMDKTLKGKKELLESIRDGYLLRDILQLDNLKNSLFIFNLLRLIAFQIGNDISYSELANNLNANKKTVMRYLELLEKSFVIFSLCGFSRNLRKEYTKTPRYYFWDNGVRNAIISNYNGITMRDDIGKLWENYCISERIKKLNYKNIHCNKYFWRTYDQKEIDLVEERGGRLWGFECKWKVKNVKPPKDFIETYKDSKFTIINQDNYFDIIG
ncbi:MAG: ATP-binding protein [Elusimicrobia bacterium]|nr:ATP-binding protein [Elusimicrobiota bacterium]